MNIRFLGYLLSLVGISFLGLIFLDFLYWLFLNKKVILPQISFLNAEDMEWTSFIVVSA